MFSIKAPSKSMLAITRVKMSTSNLSNPTDTRAYHA